jgi:signal transduction histidine kinase
MKNAPRAATRWGILVLVFGAVLLFLIANSVISYQMTWRLIDNERWVTHTHEVLNEIAGMLSAVKDAETGERGFLITGEESYLAPYSAGLVELRQHLDRFRFLTVDNRSQQRRLAELMPLLAAREAQLADGIDRRRAAGADGARASMLSGEGQRTMDAIRWAAGGMTAEENRLLRLRGVRAKAGGRAALWTLSLANLLLLALVAAVAYLTYRDLRQRRRAEEALRAAHDELEVRVDQRTAELAATTERLQQSTLELERSNRELQDFAFVASHDLQEPLRKIQAFGDRLKSKHGGALGTDGVDYLARMQGAAHRMHTLINDLLTFSRVTSKAQPFVPVDLDRIATEVLSDLEERIERSGARVETAPLPTLDADPLQMRQLLQNLVANALKFHRAGETPVVRILSAVEGNGDGPQARITVADNGIGFDMKYLDRIFTPFQRLHGRSEYEGTGMGLAVCRRIVEHHGGTLTAESAPGQGARFLVTLPVHQG